MEVLEEIQKKYQFYTFMVAMLAWLISLVFLAHYYSFNISNTAALQIKMLDVALLTFVIVFFPLALSWSLFKSDTLAQIAFDSSATVIVLFLLSAFSFILNNYVIFVLLIGLSFFTLVKLSSIHFPKRFYIHLVFLLVVLLVYCGNLWKSDILLSRTFYDPIYRLLFGLNISQDNLFYAESAGILKSHFPLNNGLNGFTYQHAYYGFSFLIAGFSSWLKMLPLNTLVLLGPALIVPILIKNILLMALHVVRLIGSSLNALIILLIISSIGFLLTPHISFPYDVEEVFQQTFATSLAVCLGFSSTVLYIVIKYKNITTGLIRGTDLAFIIMLPLLLFLIGYCKISNLILVSPLCLYLSIRLKLYQNKDIKWVIFLCAAVASLSIWLFYPAFYASKNGVSFRLFDYVQTYSGMYRTLFLSQTFMFIFLTILSFSLIATLSLINPLIKKWFPEKCFLLEFYFFSMIVFVVPFFILKIPGGSTIYFMIPFRYISLYMFLFLFGKLLSDLRLFKLYPNIKGT